MLQLKPAPAYKSFVKSFCRRVVPGGSPVYVKFEPLAGEPMRECFSIVPKQIESQGGVQRIGWAIWYLRGILIEAEFHCVWEREDGVLVDLTPRRRCYKRTLFLPDPSRQYEGVQVNNIRQALSKDPLVHRFLWLKDEFFRITNEGDLAYEKCIPMTARIVAVKNEMTEIEFELERRFSRGSQSGGLVQVRNHD